MANWTDDLESIIYTIIKTKFPARLKNKYPNLYFTNSDKTDTEPKFPTVYVHELPGVERGEGLDGTDINAILYTIQIDVSTNTRKADTKEIMSAVTDILKSRRFVVAGFPTYETKGSVNTGIARFRRMIGANDIL